MYDFDTKLEILIDFRCFIVLLTLHFTVIKECEQIKVQVYFLEPWTEFMVEVCLPTWPRVR